VCEEIPNRPTMVCAVASRRVVPNNDEAPKNVDLAIVNLNPLPDVVLDSDDIDEVIRLFCNARRIGVVEVQPCCLGQAYVRFARALDRDILVQ
jgi:hypothetical protein